MSFLKVTFEGLFWPLRMHCCEARRRSDLRVRATVLGRFLRSLFKVFFASSRMLFSGTRRRRSGMIFLSKVTYMRERNTSYMWKVTYLHVKREMCPKRKRKLFISNSSGTVIVSLLYLVEYRLVKQINVYELDGPSPFPALQGAFLRKDSLLLGEEALVYERERGYGGLFLRPSYFKRPTHEIYTCEKRPPKETYVFETRHTDSLSRTHTYARSQQQQDTFHSLSYSRIHI